MKPLLYPILVSFLFGVSSSAALLGGVECTYGPSYWCHNIKHAKQCGAVNHCIQTVWENTELPVDNDEICTICKDMVQEARDTLQSNQTQEDLKAVFDGACQLVPIKVVADECMELAADFIPELIETLSSQMNPQVVCATAGLCNSARVDKLLIQHGMLPEPQLNQEVETTPSVTSACTDCDNFIGELVENVRSHSKQDLMDHLQAICGQLGSLSDGCTALVMVNIDTIYDYLTKEVNPPQVCAMFGMCSENFDYKKIMLKDSDEVCDFCVVIAKHWRDEMASKSSVQEFKEVLEGICKKTGSFADECRALVDTYALDLYNQIVNDFDPKAVCEMIGLCKSASNYMAPLWSTLHTGPNPEAVIEEIEPSHNLQFVRNDELNSNHLPVPSIKVRVAGEIGRLDQQSPETTANDEVCTLCQFALHFIQVQLQDQSTREAIESAVKNVCTFFPNDLQEQCQDYVDAYGDQVIALLQQEIDPSIICPMLGLCDKVEVPQPSTAVTSEVTCVACEFIMKKVKHILSNRTNEEAVKNALDQVCSFLPGSLSDQCTTFVDQNAIEVMELIAAGVDPEEVCKMLKFCDKMTNAPSTLAPLNEANQLPMARLFIPGMPSNKPLPSARHEEEPSQGQGKVCVLCEMVMLALEKLVTDNSTHIEADIQHAMDVVCLHLPITIQEDCLGFVDQYSKAIIELIVSKATPGTVCRGLDLCAAPALPSLAVVAAQPAAAVSSERSCLICKAVLTKAHNSAQRDEIMGEVCMGLDAEERDLCEELSGQTWDSSKSRSEHCSSAGHCEASSGLIGSERCTWGPSYWCQSKLHAQSCGTVQHCTNNVW